MRFFADECVDHRIVRSLRSDGHEVLEPQFGTHGAPDASVLKAATAKDCILLTADSDFGALLFRDGMAAKGVFYFRSDDPETCIAAVQDHLDDVAGAIVVVTDNGVRKRPLSPGAF